MALRELGGSATLSVTGNCHDWGGDAKLSSQPLLRSKWAALLTFGTNEVKSVRRHLSDRVAAIKPDRIDGVISEGARGMPREYAWWEPWILCSPELS